MITWGREKVDEGIVNVEILGKLQDSGRNMIEVYEKGRVLL